MGNYTCKAVNTHDTNWEFCPNIGAAYVLTVLFAATTVAHIVQAVVYRKGYSWVIILAGAGKRVLLPRCAYFPLT